MDIVTIPGLVDGVTTRKDRTVKITFSTQELPPNEAAVILGLNQKLGVIAFAEKSSQISQDIMDIPVEFPEEKSPAKRLKNVLYRLWEQEGKQQDFEVYYRQKIERAIESIKEKLN